MKAILEEEEANIVKELEDIAEVFAINKKELEKNFGHMQTRFRNVGLGLIMTKTGKPIPDKVSMWSKVPFKSRLMFPFCEGGG